MRRACSPTFGHYSCLAREIRLRVHRRRVHNPRLTPNFLAPQTQVSEIGFGVNSTCEVFWGKEHTKKCVFVFSTHPPPIRIEPPGRPLLFLRADPPPTIQRPGLDRPHAACRLRGLAGAGRRRASAGRAAEQKCCLPRARRAQTRAGKIQLTSAPHPLRHPGRPSQSARRKGRACAGAGASEAGGGSWTGSRGRA